MNTTDTKLADHFGRAIDRAVTQSMVEAIRTKEPLQIVGVFMDATKLMPTPLVWVCFYEALDISKKEPDAKTN